MWRRMIVGAFIALLLGGCSDGARIELSVETEDPEVVRQVQRVLYYRLTEASRNPFSNLRTSYSADTGRLVFEYDRSAPDPASLRFLTTTQGNFRLSASGDDGDVVNWVSNADIETADSSQSKDKGQVFLAFRNASLERLGELSLANQGTSLNVAVDERVIDSVVINSKIRRYFELEIADAATARNLAIVLRSGPLPTQVSEYAP